MNRDVRLFLAAIAALTIVRLIAAAVLPLSADEAYYWLWSRHLAAGYYDHPPAIAWIIRAGTLAFGATPLGVRIGGIVLSVIATVLVWRTGAILLRDGNQGARAALFFNLTLMISVETLAATPDAPAVAAAAAVLFALAKVWETGRGIWWLGVGVAAGLSLLSKYTGFFLGAGIAIWLLLSTDARRWLLTPWPWLGAMLAAAIFAPNLVWNAQHGWTTFVFQFGRIASGSFTLRFLFEFLGSQLLLASPFLFALAALSLAFEARDRNSAIFLLAAIVFPSALYFLIHSLHDRIQGNWPAFLYPALAVAAAEGFARDDWKGWTAPVWRVSRAAAVPVAAALLIAVYTQALFGVIPFGRSDPLARLLAVGMDDVAAGIDANAAKHHARALLTTDYATTAWLKFYRPDAEVVHIGEDYRYPEAPAPSRALFASPALYVVELRLDKHALIARHFSHVTEIARIDRRRRGIPIAHYVLYEVAGPMGVPAGRMP
ncbi:MAG: glycosyltransferase family 39 protein [Alphaproteobacteria bacterium]|nr:glycosyltransferase family 39 protein [Alphaproteobacteria bacterium]MBL6939791.1 glycosyltransferase family 39 protein [Alphaproteobacteria bacterium]MBL7098244.1 glycosyltransferase family 39 protein [Alphaproteobacteria bacterium]